MSLMVKHDFGRAHVMMQLYFGAAHYTKLLLLICQIISLESWSETCGLDHMHRVVGDAMSQMRSLSNAYFLAWNGLHISFSGLEHNC